MVRKELDYFFAQFFAPKRQKSLVKQGFLPQVVKSSCNDGAPNRTRTCDTSDCGTQNARTLTLRILTAAQKPPPCFRHRRRSMAFQLTAQLTLAETCSLTRSTLFMAKQKQPLTRLLLFLGVLNLVARIKCAENRVIYDLFKSLDCLNFFIAKSIRSFLCSGSYPIKKPTSLYQSHGYLPFHLMPTLSQSG